MKKNQADRENTDVQMGSCHWRQVFHVGVTCVVFSTLFTVRAKLDSAEKGVCFVDVTWMGKNKLRLKCQQISNMITLLAALLKTRSCHSKKETGGGIYSTHRQSLNLWSANSGWRIVRP